MINNILIKLVTEIMTRKNSLRVILILPFLLKIYEKLSPSKYNCLRRALIINGTEAESIKRILRKLFELLVHLNFMLVYASFIFGICVALGLFVRVLGKLMDCYISHSNPLRKSLAIRIMISYAYISIMIYDIALLSDLIVNDGVPLKIINVTSIFWISKFSFISIAVIVMILLIIPINSKQVTRGNSKTTHLANGDSHQTT